MKKVLFIACLFITSMAFAQTLKPRSVDKFEGPSLYTFTTTEVVDNYSSLSAYGMFKKSGSFGVVSFRFIADTLSTFNDKNFAFIKLDNGEVIKTLFLGKETSYLKDDEVHFVTTIDTEDLKKIIDNKISDIRFKSSESNNNDFVIDAVKNKLYNICKLLYDGIK